MGEDIRSENNRASATASFSEETLEGYKYFPCWIWAINM